MLEPDSGRRANLVARPIFADLKSPAPIVSLASAYALPYARTPPQVKMNYSRAFQSAALSLALVACARAAIQSVESSTQPSNGTVTVTGRVTTSDGQPISDAAVTTRGGRAGVTDHDGRYSLTQVMAGPSEVVVSHSGYVTARKQTKFSTKKSDAASNWVEVTLLTPDELVTSTARATSDSVALDENGFLRRQETVRGGYFVTPQDIAEIQPRTISDIFRRVPVMVERQKAGARTRVPARLTCIVTYVNGMARPVGAPTDLETFVQPKTIMAAEVYPPDQLPPPPFSRAGSATNCTTVVLWTRV